MGNQVSDWWSLGRAALAYCARGWSVIPLQGKSPHAHEWKPYQTKRPTEEDLRFWFAERWPEAGVGIICGPISGGLVALDIDDPQVAERLLQAGLEHTTRLVKSPHGLHLYLKEHQAQSRSGPLETNGHRLGDIKAHGSYVVAPPSPGYTLLSDAPLLEVPDARAWALELLVQHGVVVEPAKASTPAYKTLKERPLHEGERNSGLTSLAGHLFREGWPVEEVQIALEVMNSRHCIPPLPLEEVRTIVQSVSRYDNFPDSQSYIPREAGKFVPVSLGAVEEPGPRRDVVDGLLPEGYPTVLFGDGGMGKSYLALGISTCITLGRSFLGLAVQASNVLYLDWELDQAEFTRRAFRVARGMGLERPPANLYYVSVAQAFSRLLRPVKVFIEQEQVGLVVVDSIGLACAGDPELARDVIGFFALLKSLGATVLAIDHQSKLQEGQHYSLKTPFGSVYKGNLSRSLIQTERVAEQDGQLDIVLHHKKFTFGRLNGGLGVRIQFDKSGWAETVRLSAFDPKTAPTTSVPQTAREKIEYSLHHDGPATTKTLVQRTGENKKTIGNELTRLAKLGKVRQVRREGHAPVWGLMDDPAPPPLNPPAIGNDAPDNRTPL